MSRVSTSKLKMLLLSFQIDPVRKGLDLFGSILLAEAPANAAYDCAMDYVCDKETGALRLTSSGIEKYRSRFARAGIDVNQIKTADEFNRAMEKSFCDVVMRDWAKDVRKKLPPSIDRNWLIAILQGDREESARLEKLVRRRESHFKS